MKMIEKKIVWIFPRKKGRGNNLKKYAELILMLDDMEQNKTDIINIGKEYEIKCVYVHNTKSNSDLAKYIENEKEIQYTDIMTTSVRESDLILYFEVYEEADHDLFIGEILCPFVLYRSRSKMECILTIAQNNSKDIRSVKNVVSRYMYYESLCKQKCWRFDELNEDKFTWIDMPDSREENNYHNQCFIYDGKNVSRLMRKFKSDSMTNVIPLIKLNFNSYYILSQSVEESFGTEEKFKELWKEYKLFEELKNKILKGSLRFDYYKEYRIENLEDYEKSLIEVLIQSICTKSLRTTYDDNDKKTIEFIYDTCRHISLLAFLFFTSFCREKYKSKNISEDKSIVIKLINLAQEYADGILQIIENAKEYADVGYMKIRIININDKKHTLFRNRYEKYFNQNKDINEYLQIQISDISRNGIVSSFEKNNQTDVIDGTLQLRDFFMALSKNKGSKLEKYYQNLENIAQHYGIRQFVSIVDAENGYFEVTSTDGYNVNEDCRYSNFIGYEQEGLCLPGTDYKILFPIHYKTEIEQEPIGFGAEVDYEDISVKNNWECKVYDYCEVKQYIQKVSESQRQKTERIFQMADYIKKSKKKKQIICFNVEKINQMWEIEIITKALILYMIKSRWSQRIALYNATQNFMINFTRYICNFYDNISKIKVGKAISETQIYICKDDYSVDLGFKGKNLVDAYVVCDYLARTRGVFNDCLELIQSVINHKNLEIRNNKTVKFAPFDLLVNLGNCTLFEERVKSDLEKDIQGTAFGCCLESAHMRVGSKMHITDKFYDATLLFASGYYTSRFAYLLAYSIVKKFSLGNQKITLVGYENYSELLVTEVLKIMQNTFLIDEVNYIIYEQDNHNCFKFIDEKIEYSEQKFIVIVPINSTLTTHSKIEAEIHKRISKDADIILNLAVILIRSTNKEKEKSALWEDKARGIEIKYWEKVDTKDRVITTKITNPQEVYYNVLVSSEWENPLKCEACFPQNNSINERPMLAMSHTSVIPMILIGLKQKNKSFVKKLSVEMQQKISGLKDNAGDIEMLRNCLIYGHIENGSNHFEYYFETERLMKDVSERNWKKFLNWLDSLKEIIQIQNKKIKDITNSKKYIYDILVAPMNRTNASFVEYVNRWAFKSVPIIVYIDANREFRDNIKTKYSNLSALYNNLMISGKNAVINFHYVDDCIISGTTFYRTRSLLKSLFPANAFEEDNSVYVNVFQNVILLLNRCSNSTKLNYANMNHFFSYIDVHISSMRTHHDKACVLCENVYNYKMLRDYSSTNEMAVEWNRKLDKHMVRSIGAAREIYFKNEGLRERHFRRLYCANQFSDELDKLNEKKNDSEEVKKLIIKLIEKKLTEPNDINSIQNNMEWMISYLKVVARPFLVFRKSTLEAIFSLLLEILENWGKDFTGSTGIYKTIFAGLNIVSESECTIEFLQCIEGLYRSIISLLSSLGAKYLVRKNSYEKLIKNDPISLRLQKEKEEQLPKLQIGMSPTFELFYKANIKRMIVLNKDETIGLWFEHLLVYGHEIWQDEAIDESFVSKYGIKSHFGRTLFLENTYIIFQTVASIYEKCKKQFQEKEGGIEEKRKIIESKIYDFDTAYFYENYRNLYNYEKDTNKLQHLENEIQQMVLLYGHLEGYIKNGENVMDYYKVLADLMQKVSGADVVSLWCYSSYDVNNEVYEIASTSKEDSLKIENDDFVHAILNWETDKTIIQNQEILIKPEEKNRIVIRFDSYERMKNMTEKKLEGWNSRNIIYCFFQIDDLENMKEYDVLCRMRNILVFRHTFVQRFRNDFYNNAFKVLTEQRHQNELLISKKAVSHTPYSTLYYVVNEVKNGQKIDLVYAAYMLQLAADSLVSQLYVDMIKKTEPCKENNNISMPFKFDNRILEVFNQFRFYSDSDQIEEGEYTGIQIENEVTEEFDRNLVIGEAHYFELILAAILHNVVTHGLADQNRKVHVKISMEKKDNLYYLCFENQARYLQKEDCPREEDQGITVVAINHYYKKNFGREVLCDFFTDKEKVMYVIKLPVYKEKIYEEKDTNFSSGE